MDERDDEEKMIFLLRGFRLARGRVGVGILFCSGDCCASSGR
jgi:hypothetical protein